MDRWQVFWAVVAAALGLAWLSSQLPAPTPADAPATAFSAERAVADVRSMARAPHPVGSAEHARVRDYLLRRLRALGLRTELQLTSDLRSNDEATQFVGSDLETIVGVLPGTDASLPALALMAHYDTVPGSPGAADDAAGTAAILETVRALKARGPAKRDLVVLITDGEENGLFGATAFWREHPLAGRIGSVINLEARGSSGPAYMFETGRNNGAAVALYGRVVDAPAGSALTTWVYDRMPNGTDFTIPKKRGVTGFNIANIGRPFDYHSPTATPGNLDRRTLQHMGGQALALANAQLRGAIPKAAPDSVYADLFGRVQLAYPAWAGWLVLLACAGLVALAVRFGGLPERKWDIARGAGLFLLLIVFPAMILHVAYGLLGAGADFYQGRAVAQFELFFAGHALLAASAGLIAAHLFQRGSPRVWIAAIPFALASLSGLIGMSDIMRAILGVTTAVLFAVVIGRPRDWRAAVLGLLLGALALALGLQAAAPQIAFLAAWPLLAGAAVAVLASMPAGPPAAHGVAAALAAVVGLGWTWRMAVPMFDGLGITTPELLGLFAGLTAVVAAPLLGRAVEGRSGAWGAAAAFVAGVVLLGFVGMRDYASPRTPQPSHVWHVTDAATGEARLVSAREELDAWTRGVMSAYGRLEREHGDALFVEDPWTVPAGRATPQFAPVFAASRAGDIVTFAYADGGAARDVRMALDFDTPPTEVTINGQPAKGFAAKGEAELRWHGRSGVKITFRAPGPGKATVRWTALADGWPADARPLPPRPADVMAQGSSDSTVVTGRTALSW